MICGEGHAEKKKYNRSKIMLSTRTTKVQSCLKKMRWV